MTDKEKIRARIEGEMGDITYGAGEPKGVYDFCKELLSFIDSLPKEPTPKGYDEAYLNECIAKASKTWEGVDVDKYMNEVRGRSPEETNNGVDVTDFCRPIDHSIAQCVDDHWWEMLDNEEPSCPEGAVDAEIVKDIHNLLHVKSGPLPMPTKVKFGDKVRIIILPNE